MGAIDLAYEAKKCLEADLKEHGIVLGDTVSVKVKGVDENYSGYYVGIYKVHYRLNIDTCEMEEGGFAIKISTYTLEAHEKREADMAKIWKEYREDPLNQEVIHVPNRGLRTRVVPPNNFPKPYPFVGILFKDMDLIEKLSSVNEH